MHLARQVLSSTASQSSPVQFVTVPPETACSSPGGTLACSPTQPTCGFYIASETGMVLCLKTVGQKKNQRNMSWHVKSL